MQSRSLGHMICCEWSMLISEDFRFVLRRTAIAWLVGCLISISVAMLGVAELSIPQVIRISIASGFLGFVAILPFSSKAVRRLTGASVVEVLESEVGLFVAFSIGMGIRIIGTVALFLACRYQMGGADGEIAAFVLAWYIYLTLIEIALVLYQSTRRLNPVDFGDKSRCDADVTDVVELCSTGRSIQDCPTGSECPEVERGIASSEV